MESLQNTNPVRENHFKGVMVEDVKKEPENEIKNDKTYDMMEDIKSEPESEDENSDDSNNFDYDMSDSDIKKELEEDIKPKVN